VPDVGPRGNVKDLCNLPAKDGDDATKLMETANGYRDHDGCADEVPAAVAKFSGVIQGINFKSGSPEILKTSNKVLDAAVKVLTEFADVRLEIQGHTDDVQPKKGAKIATNIELSQLRADSVKAYFVSKGIAADRLIAKGYGETVPAAEGTSKAARAKNRRVEFKLLSDTTEPAAETPAAPAAATP
jgi:OOP family OmpA-OmpF porin